MTIGEIRAKKNALRKKYKKIRVEITSENKSGLDLAMTQTVLSSMSYKYCKTLLLFSSFGDEPDTSEIAKKAFADGKRVFYPKSYEGGIIRFFKVNSMDELSESGMFGIKEPSEESEEYEAQGTAELCLVPGLCFDKSGYRIGYGKGYYDRFLAKFGGIAAGFVYSGCVSEEPIAFEKRYDKKVDMIFTEKGVDIVGCKKKV